MRIRGDDLKAQVIELIKVGVIKFIIAGQGRTIRELTPDSVFASGGIDLIPGIQIHMDAPNHHGGTARFPGLGEVLLSAPLAPHDLVCRPAAAPRCLVRVFDRVHGAVYLAEKITRSALTGTEGAQKALLHPTDTPKGAGVFGEHPLGMRDRQQIIPANLQEQITAVPLLLQLVDLRKRWERFKPRRFFCGCHNIKNLFAKPECDSQMCGSLHKLRFLIRQRSLPRS